MTTLTKAKRMSRVGAIGLGGALIAFVIIRLTLSLVFALNDNRQQANKPTSTTPTVKFGQIASPQLTTTTVSVANASPQLDLVSGDLPQSSPSAKVYKVAAPSLTLTAQDRARQTGAALGFDLDPTLPNPVTFTWKDPWRELSIDLTSQTFLLTTTLSKISFADRTSFSRTTNLTQPLANYARNLFKYTDMQFTAPTVRYVNPTANGEVLPQTETATDVTNFIQATFRRNDLDSLPVYNGSGKFGPITMVVIPPVATTSKTNSTTSTIKTDQVVKLSSNYFPINTEQPSTYPIISSQLAYKQLQDEFADYLVKVEPSGTQQATSMTSARVLFVRLVYLEPDVKNTQYVQPVWMFEGRGNTNVGEAQWVAYVPAVDQETTSQLLDQK